MLQLITEEKTTAPHPFVKTYLNAPTIFLRTHSTHPTSFLRALINTQNYSERPTRLLPKYS